MDNVKNITQVYYNIPGLAKALLVHITGVACTVCLQKIYIRVVYMHMRLTVNSILKDFLPKGAPSLV
jgi:hypothetical protein